MSRTTMQIIIIIAVTLGAFVVWDFSQRIVTTLRLGQMRLVVEEEVAHARATQTALKEKKQYVQTDEWLEKRVRKDHWSKENEIVVIPLVTPAPPPPVLTAPPPAPTPAPEPNWLQILADLLFGH